MSVSIGAVVFSRLTAQPLKYDEVETRRGFTARKWTISGLLTPAEYVTLIGVYDNWRNAKITEADPVVSNAVGTTVAFSGTGPDGLTWTNVPCWFITAPQGEQVGIYISCAVEVVDANQALAVAIASETTANETGAADLPDLGQITINGATLTLRKPPDTFQSLPSLQLTAGGVSYITGTKKAVEVQDIEGETDEAGWNLILSWFQTTIESTPNIGDWYPISTPTASAEKRTVAGVPTTIYTVTIQRAKVV